MLWDSGEVCACAILAVRVRWQVKEAERGSGEVRLRGAYARASSGGGRRRGVARKLAR